MNALEETHPEILKQWDRSNCPVSLLLLIISFVYYLNNYLTSNVIFSIIVV